MACYTKNFKGPKWPIKPLKIKVDDDQNVVATTKAINAGLKHNAIALHFVVRNGAMEVYGYIGGQWHFVAELPFRASSAIVNRLKIMGNLSIAERQRIQIGTIDLNVSIRHPAFRIVAIPANVGIEEVYLSVIPEC